MTSPHWDENLAEAYRRFQFQFPEKALAGKTIVVAGGTGGLGAATVVRLVLEGAHPIVGYCENRERAGMLSAAIEKRFGKKLALVEGDIGEAETRGKFLEAAAKTGVPLAGAAIFPGDPARVAWQDLNRDSLLASMEKNYVGPVLLARDIGEAMEKSLQGGSVVLLYHAGGCCISIKPELRGA
jgi:NAD(P)-dependent dehydrogenase (short-subunit alcohol dehydrogenase family)